MSVPTVGQDAPRSHGIGRLAEMHPDEVIDITELARLLGLHTKTIRRMVQRGELPRGATLGGKRQWRVGTLLSYLRDRFEREAQFSARMVKNLPQSA